jgi:hypothetical protein
VQVEDGEARGSLLLLALDDLDSEVGDGRRSGAGRIVFEEAGKAHNVICQKSKVERLLNISLYSSKIS